MENKEYCYCSYLACWLIKYPQITFEETLTSDRKGCGLVHCDIGHRVLCLTGVVSLALVVPEESVDGARVYSH